MDIKEIVKNIDKKELLKNFSNISNRRKIYQYAMKRSKEILSGIDKWKGEVFRHITR